MGFWKACARSGSVRIIAGALALLASYASAAHAVTATLPSNATIPAVAQTGDVDITIGQVTGVESVSFSVTYDPAIVTIANTNDLTLLALGTDDGCALGPPGLLSGRVNIGVTCTLGLTGSGALLRIRFTGVSNGQSALSFSATMNIPNGCQYNEGDPTCEPTNGMITVGPAGPTSTASATVTITPTLTITPTVTATATATSPSTQTATGTTTDTPTVGPSATSTQTRTTSSTATATLSPTPSSTPQSTGTVTATTTQSSTPTISSTPTVTGTATATPVPTPVISSGAIGGSTRVCGIGAPNVPAPGIEIVAENGNQVIGTGGTTGTGQFFDGLPCIGLTRPLVAGERIFPRDTVNNVTGPVVTVGAAPPAEIPTLDEYGMAILGSLLGLTLVWRLARIRQRQQ